MNFFRRNGCFCGISKNHNAIGKRSLPAKMYLIGISAHDNRIQVAQSTFISHNKCTVNLKHWHRNTPFHSSN